MSKVDAMRALREARQAAAARSTPAAAGRSTPGAPRARTAPAAAVAAPARVPDEAPAPDGLCGHRNMGGRSCTREADHQKNGTKNHRYG